MRKDKKPFKLRVQAHPAINSLRKKLEAASMQLPGLNVKHAEKFEALNRRLAGLKMPKRVVVLHRAFYAVRPCVSGIVFTAAVFASLGNRENRKIVGPMARLSDALSYHFRASRMRGTAGYNFDETQAKEDVQAMRVPLEELSKLLVECGVPVMGNPISAIAFGSMPAPNDWEIQIIALTQRVKELEGTLTRDQDLYERLERAEKIANSQQKAIDVILQRLDVPVVRLKKLEYLPPTPFYPAPAPAPVTTTPDIAPTVWCETKL